MACLTEASETGADLGTLRSQQRRSIRTSILLYLVELWCPSVIEGVQVERLKALQSSTWVRVQSPLT